jgi:hypothetical protein
MADDNTLRSYRLNDPHRRSAQPAEAQDQSFGGSDPLAELARLIGQNDPFADSARRAPQAAAPRTQDHHQDQYQDRHDDPNDWRRHVQRPNYDMPEEAPLDAARYKTADAHAGYADHDPYRMSASPQQDYYADQYAHPDHPQQGHHADYHRDPSYAAAPDYPDEQMYAVPPQQREYAGGQAPQGEEDYDDPPRRKRSGSSLVTAVILIGCAMLGTAGAYGYRTYATSPGTKQAPVIIADSAPSKVVPTSEQKSARSQDRVGAQGNNEQLVSREEQPVALPGTSAVPRVVFPSPVQPAPTTTGSTPSASQAPTDRPKPIRTVTIRPEGGDVSGQPSGTERAAPPTARTAPPPQQRAAPRDQPLSLDPNAPAQANENPRPQPQQRALTPPAPRETAAPAPAQRLASAPASGAPPAASASGGFIVQVSSQKSEADAQASYRALQAKYAQLKSHQPIIRRADLGSKGVFYRAMVGPFESGDEAVQFCNGLKQAGGQCIIHRN